MKAKVHRFFIALVFTFTAVVSLVTQNAVAGTEGHGGDIECEALVKSLAETIKGWIKADGPRIGSLDLTSTLNPQTARPFTINEYTSEMLAELERPLAVSCVRTEEKKDPVKVGDAVKICRNTVDAKGIHMTCDAERFLRMTGSNQVQQVHHEFATNVRGLEPDDGRVSSYKISEQLAYFVRLVTVIKLVVAPRPSQEPPPSSYKPILSFDRSDGTKSSYYLKPNLNAGIGEWIGGGAKLDVSLCIAPEVIKVGYQYLLREVERGVYTWGGVREFDHYVFIREGDRIELRSLWGGVKESKTFGFCVGEVLGSTSITDLKKQMEDAAMLVANRYSLLASQFQKALDQTTPFDLSALDKLYQPAQWLANGFQVDVRDRLSVNNYPFRYLRSDRLPFETEVTNIMQSVNWAAVEDLAAFFESTEQAELIAKYHFEWDRIIQKDAEAMRYLPQEPEYQAAVLDIKRLIERYHYSTLLDDSRSDFPLKSKVRNICNRYGITKQRK